MADHMTAEQLQSALVLLANRVDALSVDRNGEAEQSAIGDELMELAARLSGMAAVPVWQPIETAPRDGTEIALLFAAETDLPTGPAPRVRGARWIGDWSIPYYRDNPPIAWHAMPAAPEPPHV